MVLTNIELWAADGSSGSSMTSDFESNNPHARHLNPFDPRVVPQISSNLNHLSSNGYYGFSYINAAHSIEVNNNTNNNNNNISNINHNNNSTSTCNLMANDVNGMNNATVSAQQTHALSVNFGSSAYAAGHAVNVPRCKKRFFVLNDDDNEVISDCTATKNYNCEVSAKRCRFDDDYSAQYCNDFFQLPSTQIATQSCLMDTEEGLLPQQQQCLQQQVNVTMFENNNNNIEKFEQKLNPQLSTLSAHQHVQHSQQSQQLDQQQQQQQHEPQPQHLYHQQQHYQDTQFATIKCHLNHNNNSDILALNNYTLKDDLEKPIEKALEIHTPPNRNSSIKIKHKKYDNDAVANDLKVDDATLFAQLHGGFLHHFSNNNFNNTASLSGDIIVKKDAMNNSHLQDDNYYEEF